jgi:hypothetical protein
VKVEENKETPDLLSFLIRFICGIPHAGANYSKNLVVNLAGVLYFGFFFIKLYLPYIGTEGVVNRTINKNYVINILDGFNYYPSPRHIFI